mmetsp:Transcript_11/g.16  ORF Transcript_11/g.16 Transcript_11/m.16 type:complete len:185 (-) Transcript_11:72-626(-)
MVVYSRYILVRCKHLSKAGISEQILLLIGNIPIHLKPKLLEEITATRSFLLTGDIFLVQIPILEDLFQSLLHLNFILNQFSLVHSLLQVHIHLVTSGEHMTHIDVLHKRFHCAGALFNLLLGHATSDLTRATGDTGYKTVGETLVVVVTVFDVFDDDGFLASMSASKNNYNFSGFDNGHFLSVS